MILLLIVLPVLVYEAKKGTNDDAVKKANGTEPIVPKEIKYPDGNLTEKWIDKPEGAKVFNMSALIGEVKVQIQPAVLDKKAKM